MPISTNCLVGVIEGITYTKEQARLGVGDTLVMFTDGVNEATNTAFEEYGDARMEKLLAEQNGKTCREVIDGQLADVRSFAEGAEQSDDITLLALRRIK